MKVYAYFDEYGEWKFFNAPDAGYDLLCSDGYCSRLEIESDGQMIALKSDTNEETHFHA